ncbi:SRPBCC family protein [Streptomyces sp. TRM S81-3]|uniref:SRPBCC family protein n=1 Tax=Streptomyces griseicoloratus TaxID=2752516 RepID=A0A926QSN9_9ACTN|nr:SRPBCC family protein [Streptomyces griseicoloratus]MBD0422231.1 SRPBCC family protein [Streptomyces griseicoloratus]
MHTVEETIDVAVPVSTAYNQWTQFKSFPRFASVVTKVEQLRPNLTHWVIRLGPVRRDFVAEIVEQVPDSHVVWRSMDRTSRHRGEVTFRATAPDRTSITVRLRVEPKGVRGRLAHASGVTRRVLRAELGHFKDFIEGLGQECGTWRGVIRGGHVQPSEPAPPRSRVAHWPVG